MFEILVIDDDPVIRMLLQTTLERQGFAVSLAEDAEAGLNRMRQSPPALVVCDWQLPGWSGPELCQRVKSEPVLSMTYFILLTMRSGLEDRVAGLDAGADDFLSKPIEIVELTARVRAGLRVYYAARERQQLAEALQAQKAILEAELLEAATYVRSLLPQPLGTESLQIESRYLPSRELGGDCFDYQWLDSDHLAIYLLDVSGHGLRSALLSVSIQNLLRSQSLGQVDFYQPDQVLSALNVSFPMERHNDQYFTLWYGVYNRPLQQLSYASAGHPPALLLRPGAAMLPLRTTGLPIGLFPKATFVQSCCEIQPGSRLYLFSDGIYEILLRDGQTWGLEAFSCCLEEHLLAAVQGLPDLDELLSKIQQKTDAVGFQDDCSIIQVNFG